MIPYPSTLYGGHSEVFSVVVAMETAHFYGPSSVVCWDIFWHGHVLILVRPAPGLQVVACMQHGKCSMEGVWCYCGFLLCCFEVFVDFSSTGVAMAVTSLQSKLVTVSTSKCKVRWCKNYLCSNFQSASSDGV